MDDKTFFKDNMGSAYDKVYLKTMCNAFSSFWYNVGQFSISIWSENTSNLRVCLKTIYGIVWAMSIEWHKCFLCQQNTAEKLQTPALDGYNSIVSNLLQFRQLNEVPVDIDFTQWIMRVT